MADRFQVDQLDAFGIEQLIGAVAQMHEISGQGGALNGKAGSAFGLSAAGLEEGPTFDFPITEEQLADATGLTSVHTNRTLQRLHKDWLIALSTSKLTILDWDALAEAGDFSERYLHHSV